MATAAKIRSRIRAAIGVQSRAPYSGVTLCGRRPHSHLNGNAKKAVHAPSQLPLPTGPIALLRGGGRERVGADRDFMARAFSVRAGGLAATAVYRCLAYHCSKSERRIAYPAQGTVAEYCEITVRHVRRVQ